MDRSLTVEEENYDFWKTGAVISAGLCIITFIIFWNIGDPFWESIFRLAAFVFFAASVLCYLQIMNGPIKVTVSTTKKNLIISYLKRGKTIQEEEFKKETIKEVFSTTSGINFLQAKLKPAIKTFKVNFTDSDRDLYLFEIGGRPLLFNKQSQDKITMFLQEMI